MPIISSKWSEYSTKLDPCFFAEPGTKAGDDRDVKAFDLACMLFAGPGLCRGGVRAEFGDAIVALGERGAARGEYADIAGSPAFIVTSGVASGLCKISAMVVPAPEYIKFSKDIADADPGDALVSGANPAFRIPGDTGEVGAVVGVLGPAEWPVMKSSNDNGKASFC